MKMTKEEQMAEARRLNDPRKKPFLIPASEFRELTRFPGYCFVSDRIVIDGIRVGYRYREEPDRDLDSGWRFLAGDESEAYMDDSWNHGLYELNTICNYDPDVIPFLGLEWPVQIERLPGEGLQIVTG